jgi:hypothetical protein
MLIPTRRAALRSPCRGRSACNPSTMPPASSLISAASSLRAVICSEPEKSRRSNPTRMMQAPCNPFITWSGKLSSGGLGPTTPPRSPSVEQARRSGIGKALAILHSNGLMTELLRLFAPLGWRTQLQPESAHGTYVGRNDRKAAARSRHADARTRNQGPRHRAPRRVPTPPRQRPMPPGGPSMPIGGPAPIRGDPGTRPIARIPEPRDSQLDPGQRIGGPAPVRRTSHPTHQHAQSDGQRSSARRGPV